MEHMASRNDGTAGFSAREWEKRPISLQGCVDPEADLKPRSAVLPKQLTSLPAPRRRDKLQVRNGTRGVPKANGEAARSASPSLCSAARSSTDRLYGRSGGRTAGRQAPRVAA